MIMRSLAGFSGLAATVIAGTAAASDSFQSDGWVGHAVRNEFARFESCRMYKPFASGLTLYIRLSRAGDVRIGIGDPFRPMMPATVHPTEYAIDGGFVDRATGTVRSSRTFRFAVPRERADIFLMRLRTGRTLRIRFDSRDYTFALTGVSLAVPRLRHCARAELARERGVRPPRFGKPPPAVARTRPAKRKRSATRRANLRLKATTMVANMINQSGLRNYRILDLDRVPKSLRHYDVVWRGPDVIGGLRFVTARRGLTATRLTAALLAGDAAACKGTFKSGLKSNNPAKSPQAVRAFTQCEGPDGWRALYSILPRPKGGFVLVRQVSIGRPEQLEDADRKIVEALPAVLSR